MFQHATAFNQPLNNWDVSNVTNMEAMFENATSFNQPLNKWDVSSVINMEMMFCQATAFNQPLNNWNVSNVRNMEAMFENATSFNQPLYNWNVSRVRNVKDMFDNATAFNQHLRWEMPNVKNRGDVDEILTNNIDATKYSKNNRLNSHAYEDMDIVFPYSTMKDATPYLNAARRQDKNKQFEAMANPDIYNHIASYLKPRDMEGKLYTRTHQLPLGIPPVASASATSPTGGYHSMRRKRTRRHRHRRRHRRSHSRIHKSTRRRSRKILNAHQAHMKK
jgi:surface protein